jgi:hypothetical protein
MDGTNMLKLILAQLGITIEQAQIDKMMGDVAKAIDDLHAMRQSQDRCEAMLNALSFDENEDDLASVKITSAPVIGKSPVLVPGEA